MLAATNNYDFGYEASIARGVLDEDGKPVDSMVEDNYSRDITRCCQKTVMVLTSAVGTLILLCLYLLAGAWLFQYLEMGNEVEACYSTYERYREKLNTSVIRATGIVDSGLSKEVVTSQLEGALIDFAEALFALDFPPSRNCSNILEPFGSRWNWISALYFCATVVTTIGYGHVAPTTQWGRLVCIFYCILGIPLLLIYLGSIGQMLAYLFRFTYMNICCCRCFRDVWIRRRNKRHLRLIRLQEDLRRHMELRAKLCGEPIPSSRMAPLIPDDDSDEDEEIREIYREFQDTEDAGIPITIVMMVIAGYVTIGAFLFRIWETDWSPIDGAYFAIITISTIGFGDLVPGNGRFDKKETISELLVGAIYCILGLALLSMCFELMKEEFVGKVRWIGRSLRIMGQENGEEVGRSAKTIFRSANEPPSTVPIMDDNEVLDAVDATSNTGEGTPKDCYVVNQRSLNNCLRSASPKGREPVPFSDSHLANAPVHSKPSTQCHQREDSAKSISGSMKADSVVFDGFEVNDLESEAAGKDNEGFEDA